MALVRAQEASSSSSRQQPCIHDVFLSFRGEDIRHTFLSRLYTALSDAGFYTFKDDNGIKRGENINSELEKAIKEARSSIIVFSKDYASSRWCLDELVIILQRNRTSGHKILSVFYYVDPSDVMNQTGSFAESFDRHEKRIELEMDEREKENLKEEVEGWRAALKEVADLAPGMVLTDQCCRNDDSKFIQEIVKEIGKNVNRRVLYVAPHVVGLEPRVKSIISWLEDDLDDVGILVIYGMGGIGKTTIAKYVHNLNFERFEARSFLANVREKSEQPNGLVKLQKQFLLDILGRENEKISSVEEGITRIGDVIGCKRVLIFLDDVDEKDQLKAIIGMRDCFHPKSKIIITTRRKDLLKDYEGYMMHEVEGLSNDESMELFSWHAFRQDPAIEGYIDHSKRVVEYCGGIPLALEFLGSFLHDESSKLWENTLQKLEAILVVNILKTLKISYDTLPDDNVKNLFLHIACFFIGKDKDFTVKILKACDIYPEVGMKILINRCLLNIDEDNKLRMHQLLQDMGREIVRQESPDELGKRSRLWHNEDSFRVLKEKIGTETIIGLFLDMRLMEEEKHSNRCRSLRVRNAKRPLFEELGDNSSFANQGNPLKRLCASFLSCFPINMTVRNSDMKELKVDAFARMRELRFLQLNYAEIKEGYKDFPKELRWLCWHGFPLESIPSDFHVEFLVVLDLRYSSLKQLWKGPKILGMLKILNLSHSNALVHSPDFLQLPNLEKLLLKDCIKLVGLHDSIGKLGSLVLLNLRGCKNLRKLPREICQLKSLEELDLSGCTGLGKFLSDLGKMGSSKLVEVLGSFKLAPIGNVDSEMVNALGLTELDSNRTLQVELQSALNGMIYDETSVLQGLYECGIYSIFIRGSKIPSWFDKKSDGASSISFTIPSLPKLKIHGLSVCVAYDYESNLRYFKCYNDFIMVNNETRDQTWVYTPVFSFVEYSVRDALWLSDWKIATRLMEVGDKVNVWVERSMWRKVKEFGIRIVYDDTPTTCHQNVDMDLSNYRIGKGEYFLCTHTEERGKVSLENWWRRIGSKRANTKAEEIGYNSDGDPIEDDSDDFDWNSPHMVYESLGIARSRKKVFVGSSVVIEEITDSENSAVREGAKMEDSENQRHLKPKCE